MKLLVLGGTGGVGRHLIRQARERGHQLVVLVRQETAFDEPCVRGDPCDPEALHGALDGVDAVVSSVGVRRKTVRNPFSPILGRHDLASACARAVVEAMRDARVNKVVAVSAAGVAESEPRMNLLMRGLAAWSSIGIAYRDLAVMERIYAESGRDWCCVRPVTLTEGPLTGRIREVDRFGATMAISRADVAHYVLDRVEGSGEPRLPQIAG